ncbi:endonuclease/exonuclease/phosphatase family protein [Subtercola boreus]|uniref:Hydrolase n=1 Tax=Subtercola boreus TaxID=120213 RepID=A0A3E0W784_9MICO|nr:endonuclease/exonuclease/phosphatase family protein [Subtercola boreus]RFA18100.1 hydrolase [Subtercola boreus]RFA18482.1 hydrolase [Subtercola boreus]RFA25010.1 hydrolase [Subtercola boreus]
MTESPLVGRVEAPDLHLISFNVRRRMPAIGPRTADRWAQRSPALAALLALERPHLIGAQEVLPDQDRFIRTALGSDFSRVGRGRETNGQGEGCPIYYDRTRLQLLDWVQQALSDTPEVPGSRSWGNLTPRILVRAEFRDRATGIRLLAINTHFDHLSRRSRVTAAHTIRQLVVGQALPAVVTGDLNSGEDTAPLTELFAGGGVVDAWGAARTRLTAEWGTFPNYREPRRDRKRIDWIAVSPTVEVERIGINTERPGGVWASDHLPVQAVLRMPTAP